MTSLLKWLATNAINWDIERHSAPGTQQPQGQAPSLPSQWFNRTEAVHSSQPTCCWRQGCNWMWQVGLRVSWLTQGSPTLSRPPTLEPSPPKLVPFKVLQGKKLQKYSPEHFFVAGMNKYFSTSFWWSLSKRDILSKLGTTLAMGSFSVPRDLQFLVTTEKPITPSPIGKGQKLWEDKINPQVWEQKTPR